MRQPFNFSFRLRASHFATCRNSPEPYRHDHNYEISVVAMHEGTLNSMTALSTRLTRFNDYVVERFNGRDLNRQLPLGLKPDSGAFARYLFTWLDLVLSDDLVSITVNDFTAQPATADRTPESTGARQLDFYDMANNAGVGVDATASTVLAILNNQPSTVQI